MTGGEGKTFTERKKEKRGGRTAAPAAAGMDKRFNKAGKGNKFGLKV